MPDDRSTWARFFDAHAPTYMDNVFVRDTAAEVAFLVEALGLRPGDRVLDLGCGTGRHAVALAQRGLQVTGLDLSAGMLAQAEAAARAAGVEVRWIQADAATFTLPATFDAVLGLCEGGLGLLGGGDDPLGQPLQVLRRAAACLKPGGRLFFTVLSAARLLRAATGADQDAARFDPIALVEASEMAPAEGLPPLPLRERAFVPTELVLLCALAGLRVTWLGGGTAGRWGWRGLDPDEYEILLLAERSGEIPDLQPRMPAAVRTPA